MGCHTWCYTHLKAESERWNQELIDLLRKETGSATLYKIGRSY